MNKYYFYNKLIKIACNKAVINTVVKYVIGSYIYDSFNIMLITYKLVC